MDADTGEIKQLELISAIGFDGLLFVILFFELITILNYDFIGRVWL